MTFINPHFKTKNIKRYITDLIAIYGYSSFDDLSYSDKCEFAAHLIDTYGKHNEHEFLIESNDLDQTINTFKQSLRGTGEDDEHFLFTLKDNTIRYFENIMKNLFDEMYQQYVSDLDEWINFVSKYGNPDESAVNYKESLR